MEQSRSQPALEMTVNPNLDASKLAAAKVGLTTDAPAEVA